MDLLVHTRCPRCGDTSPMTPHDDDVDYERSQKRQISRYSRTPTVLLSVAVPVDYTKVISPVITPYKILTKLVFTWRAAVN